MQCPDRDRILAYLRGALSQEEGEDVDRHLAECSACREVAEACETAEDHLVQLVRAAWYAETAEPGSESDNQCRRAVARARELPVSPGGSPAVGFPGTVGPSDDTFVENDVTPRLFGPFELVALLGQGSYGRVYRAKDRRLDRDVAVKIPRTGVLNDSQVARFLREGRAAAQLRHQYIVPVHEAGQIEGTYYIASDFIEGTSLAARLEEEPRPLPREAALLVARLAEALHYAHSRGIVHRDVKPANILLDRAGEPHLVDFGLARRDEAGSLQTQEGVLMGTPAYMSPEQVLGRSHQADARSDLWSLGVVLYELLTGQRPFRGSGLDLFGAIRDREPEPPRHLAASVPRDLETICLKCLAKSPGRRYGSCGELAGELHRWLRGEPIEARPVGPVERSARWCGRNPVLASFLVIMLASLVGGTAVSTYFAIQARRQAIAATASAAEAEDNARTARRQENRANAEARQAAAALDDVRKAHETTRRFLYAAQMSLVMDYWRQNDVKGMETLLETLVPGEDEEDLRGFEWHYFWGMIHGHRQRLGTESEPCFDGLFADGGRTIVTSGRDIALWDAATGRHIKTITGPADRTCYLADTRPLPLVYATAPALTVWRMLEDRLEPLYEDPDAAATLEVRFSPDGKLVAVAAVAGYKTEWLKVIDLDRGEPLYRVSQPETRLTPLAFSPDSSILALSTAWRIVAGDVLLHDARTGAEKHRLQGHIAAPMCAAFSPDGRTLVSLDASQARWWSTSDGKLLKRYASPLPGYPSILVFSPDGKQLAGIGGNVPSAVVWAADDPRSMRRLYGHLVTRIAFSPDGQTVLTAGADGTCRLWDAAEEKKDEVRTSEHGRSGEVLDLAVAPDGTRVATGSSDWTLRLWSLPDGRPLHVLEGHTGPIHAVRFSADGRTLVSGSADKSIRFWDAESGSLRQIFWERAPVRSLALTRGGDVLIAGTSGEGANLWDLAAGRSHPLRRGGPSWLAAGSVAVAPDGRTVAAGCSDGVLRLWNAETSQELAALHGHEARGATGESPIGAVAFSPDGKLLASSARDMTVRLWDVEGRRLAATLREPAIALYSLEFSPDGRWLVAAGGDSELRGEIHQWDLSAGPAAVRYSGASRAWCQRSAIRTAFTPDGARLISGADEGSVGVWEPDSRGVFQYQRKWPGHVVGVQCLAFSPDGTVLAVGKRDSEVDLLDAVTGRVLHRLSGPTDVVSCLAFSPDGRTLAAGSWDATTTLWEVAGGRTVGTVPRFAIGISHGVEAVAFSHDGSLLAVSTAREVRLLDPTTLEVRRQLEYPRETVRTLAFSSDNRLLACGGGGWWSISEGDLVYWSMATGDLVRQAAFNSNPVLFARFLEGDQTLVTWRDGPVEFWDVTSGARIKTLPVQGQIAVSSDGRLMAQVRPQGEIVLWDPTTATQRAVLPPAPRPITALALSPDGQTLALGDRAGAVYFRRGAPLAAGIDARGDAVRDEQSVDRRTAALHHLARFRRDFSRWLTDEETREQAHRGTVALYEQLAAQYPHNADYRYGLAESHRLHALRARDAGLAVKEASARKAVELYEKLVREHPRNSTFLAGLRDSYTGLGIDLIQKNGERAEEAATSIRHAIEVSEQILRRDDSLGERQYHAHLLHRLGTRMNLLKRWPAAAGSLRRSLAEYAELQQRADLPGWTGSAAMWRDRSLAVLRAMVDGKGGERDATAYLHAAEAWSTLATSFPAEPRFRHELSSCHYRRGTGLIGAKQFDEAVKCLDESIATLRALQAEYSRVAQYRGELVRCLRVRARVFEEQGKFTQSLGDLDEAIALDPAKAGALRQMSLLLATLPGAGTPEYTRAAALARKAAELDPIGAANWFSLGIADYREGRWAEAATHLERARATGATFGSLDLFFLAMAYGQLGDPDRAEDNFRQAVGRRKEPHNLVEARLRDEARRLLDLSVPE